MNFSHWVYILPLALIAKASAKSTPIMISTINRAAQKTRRQFRVSSSGSVTMQRTDRTATAARRHHHRVVHQGAKSAAFVSQSASTRTKISSGFDSKMLPASSHNAGRSRYTTMVKHQIPLLSFASSNRLIASRAPIHMTSLSTTLDTEQATIAAAAAIDGDEIPSITGELNPSQK